VALPSDEYENYVVLLKEQSFVKKTLKTASKSAYKRQRNACANYAPLERTALRSRSVTDKKHSDKHHIFAPTAGAHPQTLHGDRARRGHQNGVIHFSIQRIVFPTGCTEKFGLIDRRAVSQQ